MMHQTLAFAGVTAVLFAQGWVAATVILGKESAVLRACLALPMAALTNVLLVLLFTVAGIPLTPAGLLAGHAVICAARAYAGRKWLSPKDVAVVDRPEEARSPLRKAVLAFCALLLAVVAAYSFAHAVLLPTFQYDSATNWTMRSQISYVDRRLAFDPTEDRGMAKPNYPFLFHALQIAANQGQPQWNDTTANGIHFLLSLSTFGALWIILRRLRGTLVATVALTVLLTIPLLAVQLAQGFGDITLVQTMALSLACLCMALELRSQGKHPTRWLLLSAGMMAMSVWTKSEGLQAALVPWLGLVALLAWTDAGLRRPALIAGGVGTLLSALWPLFAVGKNLNLTPHGSDGAIAFHPEAVPEVVLGMFSRGSFGIAWYAIPAAVALTLLLVARNSAMVSARQSVTLLWGSFTLALILFVYTCTPNVQFLLKAESFYRQMLIPAALLIVSCAAAWQGAKPEQDA